MPCHAGRNRGIVELGNQAEDLGGPVLHKRTGPQAFLGGVHSVVRGRGPLTSARVGAVGTPGRRVCRSLSNLIIPRSRLY
jgi:hypothetical protein